MRRQTGPGAERRAARRRCAAAGALVVLPLVAALAACAGGAESGFVERPIYPANKEQSRSLDIQVFRDDTVIRFTNTTARALPACTMWVNAAYSRPVPPVAIGETLELSLFDFKNQFNEEFRAGGFFATDKPTPLVLVQLETDSGLLGLVVVGNYE